MEKDVTRFQCDGCKTLKLIEQQHIVKAAFTLFRKESIDELRYKIRYVQMCDKCMDNGEENDDG